MSNSNKRQRRGSRTGSSTRGAVSFQEKKQMEIAWDLLHETLKNRRGWGKKLLFGVDTEWYCIDETQTVQGIVSVRQSQFTLHKHASLFHFIVPYDDVDYYKYKLPSQLVELYDFDDDSVGGYDFEDDSVGNSNDGAAAGSGCGDVIPPIASGTEHSNVDTEDDGAEERVMHVFHPTATEFVNNISGSDVVHVSVITRNGSDVNVPSFRYVHIDGLTVNMETCDSPLPGVYPFFGENLFQHVYLADLQVKYVELLYCIEMIYAKFDVWSTERVFAKTSSLSFAALQDHAHKSLMILTASTDKQVKEHLEKYVSKDSPLLESIRATAALFEQRVITAMLTGRCYIE